MAVALKETKVTQESVLILEHLAVGYGRRVVLPDVNLSLRRGSFTGLLGANGSGKSTLLKTVLGILRPLEGRIILHPIEGRPLVLGYMPQRESLDPIYPLSSFEVVLMAACGRVGPGRNGCDRARSETFRGAFGWSKATRADGPCAGNQT